MISALSGSNCGIQGDAVAARTALHEVQMAAEIGQSLSRQTFGPDRKYFCGARGGLAEDANLTERHTRFGRTSFSGCTV